MSARGPGPAARADTALVHVLVGIITDPNGRVLIAQRPGGKHLAGAWEFPGGKRDPGESRAAALARELDEELAVRVIRATPFVELTHDYPDRRVFLDAWWVERYAGTVCPREGQCLRWVPPEALAAAPILPADRPIVAAIIARVGGSAQRE